MDDENSGTKAQMEADAETEGSTSRDDNPPDEPQRFCIICKTCDESNLKEFDNKTWTAIKKTAVFRLQIKNDKYRDVTTEINLKTDSGRALYHTQPCYKNFTAVKRTSCQGPEEPSLKKPTRNQSSLSQSDTKGLLKGSCIFCGKVRKTTNHKLETLSDCLTKDGCDKIHAAAPQSTNDRIKGLGGIDLIAKEAQYHKSCRREFFKNVEGPRQKQTTPTTNRQLHAETFNTIVAFIEKEVIENSQVMLISSLFEMYKAEYLGNGGTEEAIDSYLPQALTRKMQEKFKERISISLLDSRKGNFLYSSALSEGDAKAGLHNEKEKRQTTIRSAALYLRNEIVEMPKWKTPTPTSVETLKTCSPDLPDDLILFFKTLLCGLREPTGDTNKDSVDRKVIALTSDAVFNASRGSVRPWKHTVLGLGLGTLTGSKLILRILNRLGYSLSYDEVKALETEFAFSTEESDHDVPDGIELKPDLGTGLAWDNYDVNMETLDGKETLHATVGLCYQNITNKTEHIFQPVEVRSGRNRRQFDGRVREIAPMHRQLRKASFDILAPDNPTPKAVTQRIIDYYWLMLSQEMPQPLFAGFFSQFVQDKLPKHKICYMDPIPASPTRNDVVQETMKRSMKVAVETKQDYAVVTYDLAVALKAYSIQSLEAPLFDRLLILLGNFHLELAFYGAVGTYINESGAEHLLTECDVLAEGSLNGFIRGKYYNRCSRVHEILALVMERKLYSSFISTLSQDKKDALSTLLKDAPGECRDIELFLETSQIFKDQMMQYEKYFNDVIEGTFGPTAQYWGGYVYLINRVHRELMRALRTNDIEGYIAILPTIINVFFGLNRPNYARWGVLFLSKLEGAHPILRAVLEKGAFSIRRTSKPFSRSAIDLTLEQTVNRDAASPMKGIVGFQNSTSAIRRWCITSTQRGMSVTELRRLTGLLPEEQPRAQLRPSRVKKDNLQTQALLDAVTDSCDPFSGPATSSSILLNIATGKGASGTTQEYLINSLATGHELQKKFREECVKDSSRLVKPIKRRKVNNFATENTKVKRSASTKAIPVVNSQRDKFIRMLVIISQRTNFNLEHVVSYPITDFPLAIAQPDGSLLKTTKSKLLYKLESMQDGMTTLPHIDATLVDGGLLLHSYLSAVGNISSYGNLARGLLGHVCGSIAHGKEVHVLFDKYLPSSLKESERRLRGAEDEPFIISGSEQAPKQSCQKLLQNGIFKDQLAKFLLIEWQKDQYGVILGKKTLVVSYGGECLHIVLNQISGKMTVSSPDSLQGNHEEADTLIAFHAAKVNGSLLIRATDTDVIVIILGMLGRNTLSGIQVKPIIMDCGAGNSRRYINITSIANELETKQVGLSAALPGLHAFTGCDFTSSFYRKGKIKPYELLENNTDGTFIKLFSCMSTKEEPSQQKVEEYVCLLYGIKNVKEVNRARHNKLVQMTGKINQKNPMANVKKVDCGLLPPCGKALLNKTRRAHYISVVWGNADSPQPDHDLDPLHYGWKNDNGYYVPDWYPGHAEPDNLFGGDSDNNTDTDVGEQTEDWEDTDINTDSGPEWSDDLDSESEM